MLHSLNNDIFVIQYYKRQKTRKNFFRPKQCNTIHQEAKKMSLSVVKTSATRSNFYIFSTCDEGIIIFIHWLKRVCGAFYDL